jgi:predicted NACHT family NTPase
LVKLVEIEPGRWVVKRPPRTAARSNLPLPNVISDIMEPTEQVDGKFYTSKRQFRAVGRALGLIEVGTEKPKPKQRSSVSRETKQQRRAQIKTALEKYAAGHRPGEKR